MNFIYFSEIKDASFNLALEDYLYQNFADFTADRIILLYVNEPCFVLGKNQNAFQEIDWLRAEKNNLPIYRRISGGGAVFHDLGNLNFSFIVPRESNLIANFDPLLEPIRSFLNQVENTTSLENTSDLMLGGRKISGNAQALGKKVLLQHGTLLHSSDLSSIESYLHHQAEGISSKAIRSRQNRVANIATLTASAESESGQEAKVLGENFTEFSKALYIYLRDYFDAHSLELDFSQEAAVRELQLTRYKNFQWNMAKSPAFSIKRCWRGVVYELAVEHALIKDCKCYGKMDSSWISCLKEVPLSYNRLLNAYNNHLEQTDMPDREDFEDFLESIFGLQNNLLPEVGE